MDPTQMVEDAILWLDQIDPDDRSQVGGKAANLGALAKAGLPVPPGFCLPAWLLAQEEAAWWPQAADAYRRLTPRGEAVAVRSSAAGEDSPQASYAGQFATVLDVTGEPGLHRAIAVCRASAGEVRVRVYGERQASGVSAGGLSVLVQLQVQAETAGVLFTRHPLTGDSTRLLLESTPGLGEALVSGRASPVRAILDRDGQVLEGDGGLLAGPQLRTLAGLAARVESLLGPGQDIEWALAGGEVCILQARPITGPARLPLDGVWTRANVGEVLPGPVTPLTWAIFRATLQGDLAGLWQAQKQAEAAHPAVRRIFGRVYLRLDALLDSFCYLPGVTPQVMSQALGVPLPPPAAAYTRPSGPAVRLAQAAFMLDALGLLPRLERLARRLPASPPPADQLDALLAWTARCFGLHLKATAYAAGAYGLLSKLLSGRLPGEEALLPALLLGREDLQTAAQGRELWQLAGELRRRPDLAARVTSGLPWDAIQAAAPSLPGGSAFLAAFAAFLQANGARAAGEFELAVPRWREDPSFLLGVLRGYLASGEDVSKDAPPIADRGVQRGAAVQAITLCLGPLWGRAFRRLLASYSRFSTLRENLKYRLMEGFARLRQAFLEKGITLTLKGVLESGDSVFFLTPAEVLALEQGRLSPPEARVRLGERRAQHDRDMALAAPDLVLGEDGPPAGVPQGDELLGIGCSPGVVSGPARVLAGIEQAGDLRPGEILVTPHTDPGWTPLFLSCKAVVTEIGGFLSHGATVAREYGVPCVVNVPAATARIHTGDILRVDGGSGRVTIL